jgi:hypothetical protein
MCPMPRRTPVQHAWPLLCVDYALATPPGSAADLCLMVGAADWFMVGAANHIHHCLMVGACYIHAPCGCLTW